MQIMISKITLWYFSSFMKPVIEKFRLETIYIKFNLPIIERYSFTTFEFDAVITKNCLSCFIVCTNIIKYKNVKNEIKNIKNEII